MNPATPHPERRPDPRAASADPEPATNDGDDADDTALLRLVGAVATALVALAAAGSLLP